MVTQAISQERGAQLHQLVRSWDRRLRVQHVFVWLPRAVIVGLAVGLVVAVISRLRPWLLSPEILTITLAALALALVAMLLAVWLWPRPNMAAARRFDLLFNLQERVSTALELLEGRIHTNDELVSLQVDDAWSQASTIRAREALPLIWHGREWALVLALAAVLAVLLLLPNPQADAINRNAAQQAALDAAAEELRQVTEEIASNESLSREEREQLLQALQTSLDTLQQPDITPEEAFAALSEASSALQEQSDQMNQRARAQQAALDAAADALNQAQSGDSQSGEQQNQQSAIPTLQELAEQIQAMNPAQQQQQMAQALEQAAQNLQQTNPQAAQNLQQAAEALRSGDPGAAQEAMEQAAQNLQQNTQGQQSQQQSADQLNQAAQNLQQAADSVGQQNEQGEQGNQNRGGQPGQQQMQQQPGQPGQQGQQGQPGQQGQGDQQGQQGQPGQGEGVVQLDNQSQAGQGQPASGAMQGSQPSQNPSQGGAEGVGAGAGDTPGGAGVDQANAQFGQQGEIQQNNNPDGQGVGQFDPVYAPRRIGGAGGEEITLEAESGDVPIQEGEFSQNPTGDVTVPYNQVFSDYSSAANRALQSDYIPLSLRDVVRDYFSSLEPGQNSNSGNRP